MPGSCIAVLLAGIGLASPLLAATEAQARLSVSDAVAELGNGRVYEAIALLRDVLADDPSSSPAYFYLATIYTEMGEFAKAHGYIRQAISGDPGQGVYVQQLGQIRYRQRDWRGALEAFRRAIGMGIGSNEAIAWQRIGDVHVELFDWNLALEAYSRSVRLDPGNAGSRLAIARIYLDRDNPSGAVAEVEAALGAQPALAGARALLGRAYRRLGDVDRSLDVFRDAVERDPSDQEARYGLAQALLAVGQTDQGRRLIHQYRRIQETVAEVNAMFDSAIVLIDEGKPGDASDLLEEVRDRAPTFSRGLHALGVVLRDLGDIDEAIDALAEAVRLNPLSAGAHRDLASAYVRAGRMDDALAAIRRSIVLDEDDASLYTLLAGINASLGSQAAAEAARVRAARLGVSGETASVPTVVEPARQ